MLRYQNKWKILVLAALLLFAVASGLDAQYRIDKYKYNPEEYVPSYGDAYIPGLCGIYSLFIPGTGQFVASEPRRGAAFLSSSIIGASAFGFCIYKRNNDLREDDLWDNLTIATAMLNIIIPIWSASDAVRVARVNNMALNANLQAKNQIDLIARPVFTSTGSGKAVPGFALKVRF